MKVGEKFDAFIDNVAEAEFLEGTTAAGKTTVGIFKFMMEVAESPKKLHIIAGLDIGTIEKNIINKECGIMDEWGALVEYNGNGTSREKMPHILFRPAHGVVKTIYILGYDDKKRWKKALGGQYGCLYIDEINIADMDFVREASMRCDYLLATLNPDDPSLPVYAEYINHSRPLPEWQRDTPKEILDELKEEPKPGWVHWFFSFRDNISLTEEKIERIVRNVPKGTKLYKNKIEGLRGRATGLIFSNFSTENIISEAWLRKQLTVRKLVFDRFTSGLDTSYSSKSQDTLAMSFSGITSCGKLIQLEEKVLNNADRGIPFAPSDIAGKYVEFLDFCNRKWNAACRNVFVDSADQATITELNKYKRKNGCIYGFNPSYKLPIIDRINLMLGWIQTKDYLVLEHCTEHIHEMQTYSWKEDKDEPEDRNDHTVNSVQYGWAPYTDRIGQNRK